GRPGGARCPGRRRPRPAPGPRRSTAATRPTTATGRPLASAQVPPSPGVMQREIASLAPPASPRHVRPRRMRYPARLAHLATRAIVVAKLAPTFADAHQLDHDEAAARLGSALSGPLLDDLLAATWAALLGGTKKLDEEGLLEKVAKSLRDRPL